MSWLVFFILLVTIPRYSSAFADVDTFVLFGIQIAALFEAIAMSLGEWMIMQTVGVCRRVQLRYKADYERIAEINKDQGKTTRKRSYIPELRGSVAILFVFMALLEVIGIVSQVPHFVAQIREVPITTILPGTWLWVYVATLIVAPGILQAALALGQQYRVVANEYVKEEKSEGFFQRLSRSVQVAVDKKISGPESESSRSEPVQAEVGSELDREQSDQDIPEKNPGVPTIEWWRSRYSGMNGERSEMTKNRLREIVESEWSEMLSESTLYAWVKECKESAQEQVS